MRLGMTRRIITESLFWVLSLFALSFLSIEPARAEDQKPLLGLWYSTDDFYSLLQCTNPVDSSREIRIDYYDPLGHLYRSSAGSLQSLAQTFSEQSIWQQKRKSGFRGPRGLVEIFNARNKNQNPVCENQFFRKVKAKKKQKVSTFTVNAAGQD